MRRFLAQMASWAVVAVLAAGTAQPLVASASSTAGAACACPHGIGAVCPMHRQSPGRVKCAMRGAGETHAPLLMSFVALPNPCAGTGGLVPAPSRIHVDRYVRAVIERSAAPDAPPPERA